MTHSLHRRGDSRNLADDFVLLSMPAKGFNEEGAGEKLLQFLTILLENGAVNCGDIKTGNQFAHSLEEILHNVNDGSIIHGVFSDPAAVTRVLHQLKEKDIGLSVVVSGIHALTERCCREAGLTKHTVEHSMGVFGRVERLPENDYMEVTTMCGHGMVPANLVEQVIGEIKSGRTSCEEGGRELARPCQCGVFNPVRAAKLLRKLAPKMTFEE